MSVRIVCVGRLRERFWADAAQEYLKRLSRLMPTEVIELPDEPEPAQPAPKLVEAVLRREGERILQKLPPQAHVIALCVEGRELTSPQLAQRLQALFTQGRSQIAFVIGGSLGLSPDVLARADERLSMGPMTFPHQLARVMLLEQLFRAEKMNAGERYHK